jgi:hypothetical protein
VTRYLGAIAVTVGAAAFIGYLFGYDHGHRDARRGHDIAAGRRRGRG